MAKVLNLEGASPFGSYAQGVRDRADALGPNEGIDLKELAKELGCSKECVRGVASDYDALFKTYIEGEVISCLVNPRHHPAAQ